MTRQFTLAGLALGLVAAAFGASVFALGTQVQNVSNSTRDSTLAVIGDVQGQHVIRAEDDFGIVISDTYNGKVTRYAVDPVLGLLTKMP